MKDNLELWSRGATAGRQHRARVLFGSVHEDAAMERAVLGRAPQDENGEKRAFCIASGGDTALALLAEAKVCALDINPAQIALCELKIAALGALSAPEFQKALQNDARPLFHRLKPQLSLAAREFWEENQGDLKRGLAFCGKVELVFGLGSPFLNFWLGRDAMRAFFEAETSEKAREIFQKRWNSARWRLIFRLALHPTALRVVYARGFLRNLPNAFAWRVRRRIETALLRVLPRENPYANATFRGRYSGAENGWPLYARSQNLANLRAKIADFKLETNDCAQFLENSAPNSFQFFALSNVLDTASPQYGERLLRAVARAATPGALVCLRAIAEPPLKAIHATNALFESEIALAAELRNQDLSLFCPIAAVLRVR